LALDISELFLLFANIFEFFTLTQNFFPLSINIRRSYQKLAAVSTGLSPSILRIFGKNGRKDEHKKFLYESFSSCFIC
jgi:hypothetical protein